MLSILDAFSPYVWAQALSHAIQDGAVITTISIAIATIVTGAAAWWTRAQ